jgi:inosine-uridine nucleoside N-ribohydrolase
MEPEIMERIVVVWLGAHPTSWDWKWGLQIGSSNHLGPAREFNLSNDPLGAMALFDSGVPLVWVPCKNVAEHLRTGTAEMEHFVRGQGEIGDYLADLVKEYFERVEETFPGESLSKVLWDISTIAYIINPMWVSTKLAPTPKFAKNKLMDMETVNPFEKIDSKRHLCRIAMEMRRDYIYVDFFQKLEQFAKGEISLQ